MNRKDTEEISKDEEGIVRPTFVFLSFLLPLRPDNKTLSTLTDLGPPALGFDSQIAHRWPVQIGVYFPLAGAVSPSPSQPGS